MGQPPASTPRRPMSLRRRIRVGLVLLALVLAASVVALPTLLGTRPGRALLVRVVNGRLSPGKIQLGRASLSWTRPIELGDFALTDPRGKMVLSARKVRVDRGLLALIRSGGDYGTVTIDDAMVDATRRADGSIDVLEALAGWTRPSKPRSSKPSDPAVVVFIAGRRFSVQTPELPGGIVAGAFRAGITVAPGKPADVALTLTEEGRSLDLHVLYDHRAPEGTSANVWATAIGKDWPVAVEVAGLAARGRFVGEVDANRQGGLWSASGAAELRGAVAEGAMLRGDRVALASVRFGCDVAEAKDGWKINEFEVKCPIAALKATGSIPASAKTPTRLEGHADLAALARMLPHSVRLRDGLAIRKGTALVEAELVSIGGADRLQVSASISDLAGEHDGRPLALRDPATLSGAVTRIKGTVAVERFSLRAAGIDATATGDLQRGIILNGTVDLAATRGQLGEWLDLGAIDAAGKARVKADYRHKADLYEVRFASEITALSVSGLTAAPIARDHVRVEATAAGPGSPMGMPTGWHKARVAIVGDDARADVNATADGDALAVAVGVAFPMTSPIPSRAEASAAFRRSKTAAGPVQEIDQLHLALIPADPGLAPARVALDARGRLDMAAGELTLKPIAADPAAGVGLAPVGITVAGFDKPGLPLTMRASFAGDLAAIDRMLVVWLGAAPRGLGGHWTSTLAANRGLDGVVFFDGAMNVDRLVYATPRGPIALGLKGGYVPKDDYLHLDNLDLSTRFGRLVVAGNLAKVTGDRIVDLKGTVEPRWEGLDRMVASAIEPHAKVRGTGRPFHVAGPASGGSASQILRTLDGEVGFDLQSARAFGMTLGATPIVLRLGGGKAAFDPIRASLNDGTVDILADLALDDPAGLALRIGKGSKIDGATINETVSHDILSYVAPVLSQSTQVRGKVSLALDGAVVPILGNGQLSADAQARFDKVVFQPGAFATELFSMTALAAPKMVLDQTLHIQVADGRVNQSGLAIGVGGDAKIQIDGSVGLDKTLALRAALPITGGMLGRDKAVNQLVGDTRVTVPIGGTLSHPAIDKAAFQVAVRDAAKSMVRRGVRNELGNVLDQVVPGASDARPGKPGGQGGLLGGDGLKILEGVGRDLIDPKKKP